MADRREIGLRQLRFVVANGVYSGAETRYNLTTACIDAGIWDSALDLVHRGIARKGAPQIIDLYYKGRILMGVGRWEQSEGVHKALLERLNSSPSAVEGYKAEVAYHIALNLFNLGRAREAHRFTSLAMSHCGRRQPDAEIESSFESFREIQARLERLHQELSATLAGGGMVHKAARTARLPNEAVNTTPAAELWLQNKTSFWPWGCRRPRWNSSSTTRPFPRSWQPCWFRPSSRCRKSPTGAIRT
jgi:tetratricopeptide (TPR) repeat protein